MGEPERSPTTTAARITMSSEEAGGLLRAIEAFEGHPNTKAALRLLPHVFVRPGELRHAEWADFDLDKALWTIPPHKGPSAGSFFCVSLWLSPSIYRCVGSKGSALHPYPCMG